MKRYANNLDHKTRVETIPWQRNKRFCLKFSFGFVTKHTYHWKIIAHFICYFVTFSSRLSPRCREKTLLFPFSQPTILQMALSAVSYSRLSWSSTTAWHKPNTPLAPSSAAKHALNSPISQCGKVKDYGEMWQDGVKQANRHFAKGCNWLSCDAAIIPRISAERCEPSQGAQFFWDTLFFQRSFITQEITQYGPWWIPVLLLFAICVTTRWALQLMPFLCKSGRNLLRSRAHDIIPSHSSRARNCSVENETPLGTRVSFWKPGDKGPLT